MSSELKARSFNLIVDAPADAVIDFVSDLRNLPRWCVHFCKSIRLVEGGAMVQSPSGEVYFGVTSDRETGVVDWWSGPTVEAAQRWPTRAVALADGRTLYQVTAIGGPGVDVDKMESHMIEELGLLKRLVEDEATVGSRAA